MRKLLVFVFACISLYSNSQVICGGSSATLQAGNPQNLSGPTYSMLPGPFTSTAGVFVVTPPATQSFTLYTTGTNSNNAMQTTSAVVTVTVLPQPLVNPTFTQTSCTSTNNAFNLHLTFTPNNPVPTYTITWVSIPNGVTAPTDYSASGGITAGPYQATIVAQGGCGLIYTFSINPQPAPATFSIIPIGSTFSLTCAQTSINMHVTNQNFTYTWTSISSPTMNTYSVTMTPANVGSWTVFALNPNSNCTETHTFSLVQNTTTPSGTVTPLLQNITCSNSAVATVTVFATPTVNITHYIYDPQGGVFPANTPTAIYYPGGTGTYTHCVQNDDNKCSFCSTFSVTSTQGFPTYSVTSPADNFTLGCATESIATINIVGAQTTPTPGGPITYTIIGPPTSTALQTPTLSTNSIYTINVPGTWTVIVRDQTNLCETRTPISILQNTVGPTLAVSVPLQILSCNDPSVTLEAFSENPSVTYQWNFTGVPGTLLSPTVPVNAIFTPPTPTITNTYTITITDNVNACKSVSIIPIYQNLITPSVVITNGGQNAISCFVPTITLSNGSSTRIPPGFFPNILPVVGWIWYGPTPQEPLQLSSTYIAGTPGIYTLQAKDLNNGCIGTGTLNIIDNKDYPVLNDPPSTAPRVLDCGAAEMQINVAISSQTTSLTYTWTSPTNQAGIKPPGFNNKDFAAVSSGVYTLYAYDVSNGCGSTTTLSVDNATLNAIFDPDKTEGFAPLTVNFFNNSATTGTNSTNSKSLTTLWNFGNGTILTTNNASVVASTTFSQAGTYSVVIYAQKGSCLDTTVRYIKVEIPSQVTIPNIFTPNGDGINDLFFVRMSSLHEISAIIYDRWGAKIYELINSTGGNIAWDGKNQSGTDVPDGTYFYVIKATGKDGVMYDKKGTVTLVR